MRQSDKTLKVVDFGYASFILKSSDDETSGKRMLDTYRGTAAYMAPEIKEGRPYDGQLTDVFSCGVILFILARGIYPFREAKITDLYYKLLFTENFADYWAKVGATNLSSELKDMLQRMLCYDP